MGLRPQDSFQRARLDPFPLVAEVADADGAESAYSAQQRAALAACCSPGLQVVWSPRGTATTQVLARAVHKIVGRGQRVLLVSPTDSAVAEAVAAVVAGGNYDMGAVVRVGASVLPETQTAAERSDNGGTDEADEAAVAAEAAEPLSLTLGELVDLRRSRLAEDLQACKELLVELREAPVFGQLVEAQEKERAMHAGASGYRAAVDRSRNAHHLEFCVALHDGSRLEHEHNRSQLEAARRRALPVQLRYERARLRRAYGAILLADMRLASVSEAAPFMSLRRRSDRTAAEAALAQARGEWLAADARIKALRRELAELGVETEPVPPPSVLSQPVSQSELDQEVHAVADELAPVQQTLELATRLYAAAEARLAEARRELDEAQARPLPLPEDGDSFEEAGEAGLPQLYARIGRLRDQVAETQERIEAETERQAALERLLRQEHRDMERAVLGEAKVVATTLSMLALRPAVREQTFDHVLVGDAPAADLPLVAYALGRATTGAVLIGGYESPGENQHPPRRSLGADCFDHLGLHRLDLASAAEGCVVLTD